MSVSDGTYYTLRRLHSLTGVLPIGLFLAFHLFTNSKAVHGPQAYNDASAALVALPGVVLIEIFGLGLPILFHMVLGIWIAAIARNNPGRFAYQRNWMFWLQRATGILLVFFIVYHVWSTRIAAAHESDVFALMAGKMRNPWMFAFYVLGVVSAAVHFGNGLFGFAIHWGIATGRNAQRNAARLGWGVALILIFLGVNSLLAFIDRPIRLFERGHETSASVRLVEDSH